MIVNEEDIARPLCIIIFFYVARQILLTLTFYLKSNIEKNTRLPVRVFQVFFFAIRLLLKKYNTVPVFYFLEIPIKYYTIVLNCTNSIWKSEILKRTLIFILKTQTVYISDIRLLGTAHTLLWDLLHFSSNYINFQSSYKITISTILN